MKSVNPTRSSSSENYCSSSSSSSSSSSRRRRNGVIGLGLVPDHHGPLAPTIININISLAIANGGSTQYQVFVPPNSTFGYLKSVISQKIGLKPERYKIFFRGEEKEDDLDLSTAGVKDNSEVLLMDAKACEQKYPEEEIEETCVSSKGEAAVAEVRKEVDKLEQQVSALQAVVDSGNKVEDKEIAYLTELLMRQLLTLDGIEAEGEGKVQRKMEVRRVQGIVETLDGLKTRNSNAFCRSNITLSQTSQWEAVNSGYRSVDTSFAMSPSAL